MPTNPNWSDTDAVALRQFLLANPRFLTELARRKPRPQANPTTIEASALNGERRVGAEKIIEEIARMASDAPVDEKTPFISDPQ